MKTNENGIYDARTLGLPKMLFLDARLPIES